MPSRKRAKGKERKLKQQARQSVSSSSPPPAVGGGGDISQPEQNIPRIEQAKNNKCLHGAFIPPGRHPIGDFIHTFDEGYVFEDGNIQITNAMNKTFEKHRDVWKDDGMRKMAINIMLRAGTNRLLDNFSIDVAKNISKAIILLENYDGEGTFNSVLSKALEDITYLLLAGDRDVVHFYKKRIPCSCLNKLYSEIKKSQVKGGLCDYCEQTVKRKDLKTCSRCKFSQYCSKQCQVADWPSHKETCMGLADFHKRCEKMETTRRNEE